MRDWITAELATGLQKLLCLSLEGQPSHETIYGTVGAWREILTHRKVYEQERDTLRFREAFLNLGTRCRRWPTPVDFLEAMPKIDTSGPKLAHTASEETRLANISRIQAMLGEKEDAA